MNVLQVTIIVKVFMAIFLELNSLYLSLRHIAIRNYHRGSLATMQCVYVKNKLEHWSLVFFCLNNKTVLSFLNYQAQNCMVWLLHLKEATRYLWM